MIDATHDPALECWVESANQADTDFPIQNLPYATFRKQGQERTRVGIAIGDMLLDATEAFGIQAMQSVLAMTRSSRSEFRRRVSEYLAKYSTGADRYVTPIAQVNLLLPCNIPDYTDFYASIHHATNVGRMFRPDHPLLPNYKWMPVAYHGRASSVVASGTEV